MLTTTDLSVRDEAIVITDDAQDFSAIVRPNTQAVIHVPRALPNWFPELSAAVEAGELRLPRTVLLSATRADIEVWLESHVQIGVVAEPTRRSLIQDILELTDRLDALAYSSRWARRFRLRIFAEAPTTECGFHVDSVPPGAPTFGLLRVYNGANTLYVEPDNVTSMTNFYVDLDRRERLTRDLRKARGLGDTAALEKLERDIAAHDAARTFLHRPNEIAIVPSGSIVAFKHIDARRYRTDHPKAMAWIHCSPMAGTARLVVNLTIPQPAASSREPRKVTLD